eukprot:symbB.v1.2.023139.t1/scaffold2092.1/size89876/4
MLAIVTVEGGRLRARQPPPDGNYQVPVPPVMAWANAGHAPFGPRRGVPVAKIVSFATFVLQDRGDFQGV